MKFLRIVSKIGGGRSRTGLMVPYKFSMHQMIVRKSGKATPVEDHSLQRSPMHSSYFLVTPYSLSPVRRECKTSACSRHTSALASNQIEIIVPSSHGLCVAAIRWLSNFSDLYLKLIVCAFSPPTP